jgi:hypothetical protein
LPHLESEGEPTTEGEKKEQITPIVDAPSPAAIEYDTLSAFIGELEESTASSEVSLPPVNESAFDEPDEIVAALDSHDELPNDTGQEKTWQLPLPDSASAQETDILSAALDSIDGMARSEPAGDAPLPRVEAEDVFDESVETFDEIVSAEPVEDEALPLVELKELFEGDVETFEEVLSAEPQEETSPTFDLEATFDEATESLDEIVSAGPVEDEALPLVELKELFEGDVETLEEMLSAEPQEETSPPFDLEATFDEAAEIVDDTFSAGPVEDEALPLVELEELFEGDVETLEEMLSAEPQEEMSPPFDLEATFDEATESLDEIVSAGPVENEALPLVELEELFEGDVETFEEVLSAEPQEETSPPFDLEATFDEATESLDEIVSAGPVEDEALPLVELEELFEGDVETFEESLGVEPEEAVDEFTETFDENLRAEAINEPNDVDDTTAGPVTSDDQLDSIFEETTLEVEDELSDAGDAEVESFVSDEALDAFFEEADDTEAESFVSDDTLDAFFEETDDTAAEAVVSDEGFDTLIEEAEPDSASEEPVVVAEQTESIDEQGDLRDIFDEQLVGDLIDEPLGGDAEEATMDEFQLPEESEKPVTPKPPSDPLVPFSEEQLEHMLSPTEEQVAEETAALKTSQYVAEELDLDTGNEAARESSAEAETLPLDETPAVATDYTFPAELTQARPSSSTASILWGFGIVLMCGALLLQYLYYHRLQLVENPQLRPLLVTLCEVTGCELPPRRDLGRIELTDHMMQFHPNYEQSLLLTATLANRADFAQPYPLVEVLMTDIEQRVVARRRFTAEQYLSNHSGGDSFPPNSEVPLMLEVLDPGNNAVGFEFRFY